MNFAELQTEVTNLTRRADLLTSHIIPAIKAATLFLHQSDFYPKDLLEAVVTFPTADYYQAWEYLNDVPRYRSLKYFRKLDSTTGTPYGEPLGIMLPETLFDEYGDEKTNVVYEAGLFINIKTYEQVQQFLMGCYLNPDITDAGFTSWIAEMHPYAIVYEAASRVFRQTGYKEQEQSMKNDAARELAILQRTNIQSAGY